MSSRLARTNFRQSKRCAETTTRKRPHDKYDYASRGTDFGSQLPKNMSSVAISSIVFACVFASAVLGMFLRTVLPEPHKNSDSISIVRVGMGLVGTLVAMVLGLLIASAKGFYDTQMTELTQLSAEVILLDRVLAHYGPETAEARKELRIDVVTILNQLSHDGSLGPPVTDLLNNASNDFYEQVQQLSPKNDAQRLLKSQAVDIAAGLGRTRWLMYEQRSSSVSMPLLAVLVFWLIATFVSFGIFAPPNATVVVSLFISALSVAGAIFLLLEMYTPYQGVIHISSAPLQAALASLGR